MTHHKTIGSGLTYFNVVFKNKKTISFYKKNPHKQVMMNIYLCLKLIGFRMSSTPLNFKDNYYEYGADVLETKGSEIGVY